MKKKIESEVRRLENRVASMEATHRFLLSVQIDALDKAETLRQHVLSVIRSRQIIPSAKWVNVSKDKLSALDDLVSKVGTFRVLKVKALKLRKKT